MKTLVISLFLLSVSLAAHAQLIFIGDELHCTSTSPRASRKLLVDCTEATQVLRIELRNLDGAVVSSYPVDAVVSPQSGAIEVQLDGAAMGLYSCRIVGEAQIYTNFIQIE